MIDRIERLSKHLKQEICAILQEHIDDPRLSELVITHLQLSRDLRVAKVSIFSEGADQKEKEYILKRLRSVGGHIRGEISVRVPMKYTPKISFLFDEGEAQQRHVDDIFKQLQEEKSKDLPDNEEGMEYEQD